jgi:hypothetical protein
MKHKRKKERLAKRQKLWDALATGLKDQMRRPGSPKK